MFLDWFISFNFFEKKNEKNFLFLFLFLLKILVLHSQNIGTSSSKNCKASNCSNSIILVFCIWCGITFLNFVLIFLLWVADFCLIVNFYPHSHATDCIFPNTKHTTVQLHLFCTTHPKHHHIPQQHSQSPQSLHAVCTVTARSNYILYIMITQLGIKSFYEGGAHSE